VSRSSRRCATPLACSSWPSSKIPGAHGGQAAKLKGRLDGLLYGKAWLLAARQSEGQVAPTEGRAIDHLAFSVPDLDRAAAEIKQKGIHFSREPWLLTNGPFAKASTVMSPDGVRVEIEQP
jgi:hypothetical protein